MPSGSYPILRFRRIVSTTAMDARRFFSQRSPSRALVSQDTKPTLKSYRTLADNDQRTEHENQDRSEKGHRRVKIRKMNTKSRNGAWPSGPLDSDSLQAQVGSSASQWLSKFPYTPIAVPLGISSCSMPSSISGPGDSKAPLGPLKKGPLKKHTEEDRQKVEVVLTTPVPILAHYVPSDMIEMIKKSPFVMPGKDEIVLRSDRFRTTGLNRRECYKFLTRLLRNVASAIVYREERIAADKKRHTREEDSSGYDPE